MERVSLRSGCRHDGLLFSRESLAVMRDRVLTINLSKTKLNLKRNFKFLKTRLLLLRQLFLTEIRYYT